MQCVVYGVWLRCEVLVCMMYAVRREILVGSVYGVWGIEVCGAVRSLKAGSKGTGCGEFASVFWVRVGAIDLHKYHTYINIDIDMYNIMKDTCILYIHITSIHTHYTVHIIHTYSTYILYCTYTHTYIMQYRYHIDTYICLS